MASPVDLFKKHFKNTVTLKLRPNRGLSAPDVEVHHAMDDVKSGMSPRERVSIILLALRTRFLAPLRKSGSTRAASSKRAAGAGEAARPRKKVKEAEDGEEEAEERRMQEELQEAVPEEAEDHDMYQADELAMALAMSMETVLPFLNRQDNSAMGEDEEFALAVKMSMGTDQTETEGQDTAMQSMGAAGDVDGASGTGGGGVRWPNGVPPEVITNSLNGYFNMMTHAGDLDPRYVQRLRVDPVLREIAELQLNGDGDYDIRAAILDAVIFMVEEEGEGGDDDGW